MNETELAALVAKVRAEVQAEMKNAQEAMKGTVEEVVKQGGYATKEQYDALQAAQKESEEKVIAILEKQGLTLADLQAKSSSSPSVVKSISEILKENEDELKATHRNQVGVKEFMLFHNEKGEVVFKPFDRTGAAKAAGTTGTVDGLSGVGSLSSVIENISSASILRMNAGSQIVDNYANTPWIFDLINTTTADFYENSRATYWEELPREGAPAIVAEGATKPLVQYRYVLRSQEYKKFAQLIRFTDEFSFDFRSLQDDIMGKGRRDLRNGINSLVLTDLIAAATAYNTPTEFGTVPFANDFDAIAAMAAQVDNATYGNNANAAIMSTFKKYRMGVEKAEDGNYLNRPAVLSGINFVGNPDMAADAVVVGDLKQYNVIWRGGIIVKIGYNGTDFAENKFSVVMEQFYYNYISEARKSAIVKGPTFTAVKEAIIEPVAP